MPKKQTQSDTLQGKRVRILPSYHAPKRRGQIGTVMGRAALQSTNWRVQMPDGVAISVADAHLERVSSRVRAKLVDARIDGPFDPARPDHQRLRRASERITRAAPVRGGASNTYTGHATASVRPGADDHLRHPSRHNGLRTWPDGRTEAVQ